MFENIAEESEIPAKAIFKWMFNILQGNVTKKEKIFTEVIGENFKNGQLLKDLIVLVEKEKKLS